MKRRTSGLEATADGMIKVSRPFFPQKDIEKIKEEVGAALSAGVVSDGSNIELLEEELSKYIGVDHVILVSSGTSALEVVMRFLGSGGKEVIIPTNTCVSAPHASILSGNRPVFTDVDAGSLCASVEDIKKNVSEKSAAAVPTHIAGLVSPDMVEIAEFCKDRGILCLEDSCHSLGAKAFGKNAGTFGDVSVFSFYPTKPITAGQGGAIATDDEKLAEHARMARNYGCRSRRGISEIVSGNSLMNEINAILGRYQLRRLDEFIEKKNRIARYYIKHIDKMDHVSVTQKKFSGTHTYYKFLVTLDEGFDGVELRKIFREKYRIELGDLYYPPCHMVPSLIPYVDGGRKFPVADSVLRRVVCLPMHVCLTKQELNPVIEALEKEVG